MTPLEMDITRKRFSRKATGGDWRMANGDLLCFTVEDPVQTGPDNVLQSDEKIFGNTAIPVGRYEIALTYSPRFKQIMPQLLGVAHFDGIRVHVGNGPDDTHGCILVGITAALDSVLASRMAYEKVCKIICDAIMRGQRVFVTISGHPPETFWKEAA